MNAASVSRCGVPAPVFGTAQAPAFSRPENGLGALGIGSIRADRNPNGLGNSGLQKCDFRPFFQAPKDPKHVVEIHPSGVIVRYDDGKPKKAPKGGVRGEISGFSDKASRRLKEFCVRYEVKGGKPVSVTLTTHRLFNANEWRNALKRMRMRVLWNGWAGIWRVELQRRKTPHLHVSLWLSEELIEGRWLSAVRDAWLESTGESGDIEARRVAVRGRVIEGPGWAVYMALHDGKHKAEQLGWLGKQWGVWNREKFTLREPSGFSGEVNAEEYRLLMRMWNRWERVKKKQRVAWLVARAAECPEERRELNAKAAAVRRGLRRSLPAGGFMRCVEGAHFDRFFAALWLGRVSSIEAAFRAAASRPLAGPAGVLPKESVCVW